MVVSDANVRGPSFPHDGEAARRALPAYLSSKPDIVFDRG